MSNIHLSGKDRLSLFTDLSTMLTAGIPILETVESLEEDSTGGIKRVLKELHKTLVNGEPLSQGLSRFPNAIDPVTVNTIRAAETGGTLEATLQDLVKTMKKELAFSDSLRMAMLYPAFIGVIFMGIIILMLTFVVPKIAQVFSGMRIEMPLITKIMIVMSNFFIAHWPVITVGAIGMGVGVYALIQANRRAMIRLMLSLPGLHQLGLNIDLARLTRSFGLVVRAGLPLEETLSLSKRVVNKPQILKVVEHMEQNVGQGKALGDGLKDFHKVVPPIMARSITTAESSGTLEQTMQNLAEYFDDQVAGSLKAVSSMIEPILIVVIGVMVGSLMITIIAPIYNMISQISPK